MDEATAALDPLGQDKLMRLLLERLPKPPSSASDTGRARAFHTPNSCWNITPTARAWS